MGIVALIVLVLVIWVIFKAISGAVHSVSSKARQKAWDTKYYADLDARKARLQQTWSQIDPKHRETAVQLLNHILRADWESAAIECPSCGAHVRRQDVVAAGHCCPGCRNVAFKSYDALSLSEGPLCYDRAQFERLVREGQSFNLSIRFEGYAEALEAAVMLVATKPTTVRTFLRAS